MKKILALLALISFFNISATPVRLNAAFSKVLLGTLARKDGLRGFQELASDLRAEVTIFGSTVCWECPNHDAAQKLAQEHFYIQDKDIVWYGKANS